MQFWLESQERVLAGDDVPFWTERDILEYAGSDDDDVVFDEEPVLPVYDPEQQYLHQEGLGCFSADEYMDEIDCLYRRFSTAGEALDQPVFGEVRW